MFTPNVIVRAYFLCVFIRHDRQKNEEQGNNNDSNNTNDVTEKVFADIIFRTRVMEALCGQSFR